MKNNHLLEFAKIISGIFSNKEQALRNPNKFANINIHFRPLLWDFFNCYAFYSEQSYDHDPWNPYRQSINKLSYRNKTYIIVNYKIENQIRYSGGGKNPHILQDIYQEKLIEKKGCAMHFSEISPGNYAGNIEPGEKCLALKGETLTYIKSQIEINKNHWISEDSGYNKETNQKIWGSEYGPLEFMKVKDYNNFIEDDWSHRKS